MEHHLSVDTTRQPADTPMMEMFKQWDALQVVAHDNDSSEEVAEKAVNEMLCIEHKMVALKSTCLEDFAAKLIAYTGDGQFCPCDAIIAEAQQLIGLRG